MLKNDDFVIAKMQLDNIAPNSVGVIRAINGKSAMVLFIGLNELKRVDFSELQAVDIYKTGKGYDKKICNICHILKDTDDFEISQTDSKEENNSSKLQRMQKKY